MFNPTLKKCTYEKIYAYDKDIKNERVIFSVDNSKYMIIKATWTTTTGLKCWCKNWIITGFDAGPVTSIYYTFYQPAGKTKDRPRNLTEAYGIKHCATHWMEELVTRHHGTIMDKYDPQKQIALVVDEWGTWFNVEPGTNPGFLYQQNTLRDALVAGISLNIFNNHCDQREDGQRSQMVNVLQAVILTKGEEMVLTPTYYVFKMYNVHHPKRSYVGSLFSPLSESLACNTFTIWKLC